MPSSSLFSLFTLTLLLCSSGGVNPLRSSGGEGATPLRVSGGEGATLLLRTPFRLPPRIETSCHYTPEPGLCRDRCLDVCSQAIPKCYALTCLGLCNDQPSCTREESTLPTPVNLNVMCVFCRDLVLASKEVNVRDMVNVFCTYIDIPPQKHICKELVPRAKEIEDWNMQGLNYTQICKNLFGCTSKEDQNDLVVLIRLDHVEN